MPDTIDREVQKRWRRINRRLHFLDAKLPPVGVIAASTINAQRRLSGRLLQPWLTFFDAGFRALYLLFYVSQKQRFGVKPGNPSFLFLLGRGLNLVAAIRLLALSGFDQAARPLLRAMVENLDLAAAVLHDEELALEFVAGSEDEAAARKFWQQVVARGKLHARVEKIAASIGLNHSDTPWFVQHRLGVNDMLSPAVHSSFNSAFLSTFVPSIQTPGRVVLEPLGEVSIHTPSLLDFVAKEIQLFMAIAVKLIITEPAPELFQTVDAGSPLFQSMIASAMLLQELVESHGEPASTV